MVFSAEHYAPIVHNWVCWAAPVHDPVTRRAARRHRPVDHVGPHPPDRPGDRAGDGAADRDRHARQHWRPGPSTATPTPQPGLSLTLLGTAEAWLDGRGCCSTGARPRSSRCSRCTPRGCRLEQLHALAVRRPGRHALHPQGRGVPPAQRPGRPARLAALPPHHAGHHRRRHGAAPLVRRGDVRAAVEAYGGDLLPGTNSRPCSSWPTTSRWPCARPSWPTPSPMRSCATPSCSPYDTEVVEVCLATLGEPPAPEPAAAQGPARRRPHLTLPGARPVDVTGVTISQPSANLGHLGSGVLGPISLSPGRLLHGQDRTHRRRGARHRRRRASDAARPAAARAAWARPAPSSAATPATAAPAPSTWTAGA